MNEVSLKENIDIKVKTGLLEVIKTFQQRELTECLIYEKLAKVEKEPSNKAVLEQIARDEKAHSNFWKIYSKQDVKPTILRVWFYYWIARVFGLTFGIKLMEKGEEKAQINYAVVLMDIPQTQKIIDDENAHEQKLIAMINEEKLKYIGSIVLGLNDALIELTGVLAGLTFALQNTRIIALAGLITGIAASFSMAASEYLSQKHEGGENALGSAIYTGITYILTVVLLILPYLLMSNYTLCLVLTIVTAIIIILLFNYYISIAKDLPFKRRFLEMVSISLIVSAITFGVSLLVKKMLGVEI
jgi:vacuolar iron transporter family protein